MNINRVSLETHGNLQYGNNPQYLILHHADMNGTIQDVNQVHLNKGWCMIGYNYYVRKDGSIWAGRPENAIGANCYGYNDKSIGVCAEGNFMNDTMSDAQKQAIIWLGQYIENEYGNRLQVIGHKEVYATDCPGDNYPLSEIKNDIKNNNSQPQPKPIPIPSVKYQAHVQNIGWQPQVSDGSIAGTEGKALRMESLVVVLENLDNAHLNIEGHIQNIGWQTVRHEGEPIGTVGLGLRLEAAKISLVNAPGYHIQYQVHVQNKGWMDWVQDGAQAGTTGEGLRIEAIRIKISK